MAFRIWLTTVFSKFIHIVKCISVLLLSMAKYSTIRIHPLLLMHSSIYGHLGCWCLRLSWICYYGYLCTNHGYIFLILLGIYQKWDCWMQYYIKYFSLYGCLIEALQWVLFILKDTEIEIKVNFDTCFWKGRQMERLGDLFPSKFEFTSIVQDS